MNLRTEMEEYYCDGPERRDPVYLKPERRNDLQILRAHLYDEMVGRHVLEIACGTGYWTQLIASVAHSVCATDASEEMLGVARNRLSASNHVTVKRADAYHLESVTGHFNAAFAGLWWSHVPREDIRNFLSGLHSRLTPGSIVVFIDNSFIENYSRHIVERDEAGNAYEVRRLASGRKYTILKNYPTESELRRCTDDLGKDVEFNQLTYYWCLTYRTTKA